jgi:hypothetical protein
MEIQLLLYYRLIVPPPEQLHAGRLIMSCRTRRSSSSLLVSNFSSFTTKSSILHVFIVYFTILIYIFRRDFHNGDESALIRSDRSSAEDLARSKADLRAYYRSTSSKAPFNLGRSSTSITIILYIVIFVVYKKFRDSHE